MDCERFDKTTMDLLYGELDELSAAAALRHLHHCTRCRDIWGHLRTTRELSDIPQEDPPADLFDAIMSAEANAHRSLPARERFSRGVSVLAGYAMKPQLAMAALLLLMIGSSLVFVRSDPRNQGQVSVTERGTPHTEALSDSAAPNRALVFEGERNSPVPRAAAENDESEVGATATDTEQPSDRLTYNEAMAAYQEGRYAEAERLFSEVASAGGERAASAALHEGHAARNGSGCQRAAALYDAVAARYSGGTVADEASWHAATCYRAMGQLKRASAHYTALKDRPAYAARAESALAEIEAQLVVADAEAKTPPTEAGAKPTASAGKKSEIADAANLPAPAAPKDEAEKPADSKEATPPPKEASPDVAAGQ